MTDALSTAIGEALPHMPAAFHDTMRFLDRMQQTFSKNAPPVVVHSRRELRAVQLLHRLRRRTLAREYRRITGESLFKAWRAGKAVRS